MAKSREEMIRVILDATERYSKRRVDSKGKGFNVNRLEQGKVVTDRKVKELYLHVLDLDSTSHDMDSKPVNRLPKAYQGEDMDSGLDSKMDSDMAFVPGDVHVEEPVNAMLTELERQNEIIASLSQKFAKLEQENSALKQNNEGLQQRLDHLEQAYRDLDKGMDSAIQKSSAMDHTIQMDSNAADDRAVDRLYGFCLVQRKPYANGKKYWYAGRMFSGKQKWVYIGKDKDLGPGKIYQWLQKHQPQELENF